MYILIHEYYVLDPSFTIHNILFLADAYMFRSFMLLCRLVILAAS